MKFTSMHRVVALVVASLLVAPVVISKVAKSAKAPDGPTAENAMAAGSHRIETRIYQEDSQ